MLPETEKIGQKIERQTLKASKPDFTKSLKELLSKDRRAAFHYWKGVQERKFEELGKKGNINLEKHKLNHQAFVEAIGFVDKLVDEVPIFEEEKNSNYYEAEIFVEEYNKERQKALETRGITMESLTKEAAK